MVQIVIALAASHVRSKLFGQLFGFVARDQIDYMVRHQSREPSDLVARVVDVVGYPDRSCAHHPDTRKITTRLLGALSDKPQTPLNEMRIGELENYPVGEAARRPEHLWTIAGHPHRRRLACGPIHLDGLTIVLDRFGCAQVSYDLNGLFEPIDGCRPFPHYPPRAVPATDAKVHSISRNTVQGRQQAGSYRWVPYGRISHTGTEPHSLSIGSKQSQDGIWLLPQHMRVEDPAVGEAGLFGLAGQPDHSFVRHVTLECDCKFPHMRNSLIMWLLISFQKGYWRPYYQIIRDCLKK